MDEFLHNEFDVLQSEFDRLERQIDMLQQSNNRSYTVRETLNQMDNYTEEEFRRRFRLTKYTVNELYQLIGLDLEPLVQRKNFTLSGMDKILMTLRYYATASFHIVSADFYGVSETFVCKIVPVVSNKIASLRNRFIKMPSTDAEIQQKNWNFFEWQACPISFVPLMVH